MSNIKKLLDIIDNREYTPYEEIKDFVRQIDNNWRPETAYCQLRKQKPDRRDYKYSDKKPSNDNPVVGYRPLKAIVSLYKPHSEDLNKKTEETLNKESITLLGKNRLKNINEIREVNNAIRSKVERFKKAILEKYEN